MHEDSTCDHCGRRIDDIKSVKTSDIADGMFFCSTECMEEYEENHYECEVNCPNCGNWENAAVMDEPDFKEFFLDDDLEEDEEARYTCKKCYTTGILVRVQEVG